MNLMYFGDSYDIVKRFFALELSSLGYDVFIDPMLTGNWGNKESLLYEFLQMRPVHEFQDSQSALFLDPDTGIGRNATPAHTTIENLAALLQKHEIVFCFDQSFSRAGDKIPMMRTKLERLSQHGGHGFYFNSHALFLFASRNNELLEALRQHFRKVGLPNSRFVS